ncbi:MAG: RraA family protein [Pseudomonadota bacterium]
MDDALLDVLRGADTPTICNAIEVVQGGRGFSNFTKATMLCSHPAAGAIVGYARTAKIRAAHPPAEPPDVIRTRRMAYYRHMASGPTEPMLAVIEDEDGAGAVGAFWGEINTSVHKGLGLSGAVTNGVMRDLGDLPDGFPVIAGHIGPSHAFVHVTEIGGAVGIFGMKVCDGDLVHADQHGALVIPKDVVPELGAAVAKLRATEALILGPAQAPGFDLARFEEAWAAFESART